MKVFMLVEGPAKIHACWVADELPSGKFQLLEAAFLDPPKHVYPKSYELIGSRFFNHNEAFENFWKIVDRAELEVYDVNEIEHLWFDEFGSMLTSKGQ